jgi:hypothetical protein
LIIGEFLQARGSPKSFRSPPPPSPHPGNELLHLDVDNTVAAYRPGLRRHEPDRDAAGAQTTRSDHPG